MMRLLKDGGRAPKPGRFSMPCACAVQDKDYVASWAREEGERLYRLVSVVPAPPRSRGLLDIVHGLLRPPEPLRVAVDELADRGVMACPGCKVSHTACLCARCHAFVCGGRSRSGFFVCRKSCGASFTTQPLDAFDGQAGGAPPGGTGPRLAPPSSTKFLPRR